MTRVPFQLELRPALPNVYGASDYREFRETLFKIDEILVKGGLEHSLINEAMKRQVEEEVKTDDAKQTTSEIEHRYKTFRYALRCNIARHLTGESYRKFSIRLADSELFQWFTSISAFGTRKAISKSSLERYEKYFDEEVVAEQIHCFQARLAQTEAALALGLTEAVEFRDAFIDSTCIKADIHFPVDWVLLRDAARSLLLAIKTIRKQGLKHRMIEPQLLLKQMNQQCIRMTHSRRRKDSKRQRKNVLREMKKLVKRIEKHAKRYRDLLEKEWGKTDWTLPQSEQVIRRIDNILEQLPAAVKQAHERIIGERQLKSSEKILSLYDRDAHVIVRGKAGNEVEFGQGLVLTEQKDGLIIDWEFFKEMPSDSKLLQPVLERIEKHYGRADSVCTDRGFDSKDNANYLMKKNIRNAVCPKSPSLLQDKINDPIFLQSQTRRSQTEARIGIFKNSFLGKPLRSRITANKRHAIHWSVLTHNLWVLARLALANQQIPIQKAA